MSAIFSSAGKILFSIYLICQIVNKKLNTILKDSDRPINLFINSDYKFKFFFTSALVILEK